MVTPEAELQTVFRNREYFLEDTIHDTKNYMNMHERIIKKKSKLLLLLRHGRKKFLQRSSKEPGQGKL